MKLSLSLRYWQNFPFDFTFRNAVENRFNGIELYNPLQDDYCRNNRQFRRENANALLRTFSENRISLCCLDTSVSPFSEEDFAKLSEYIEYADSFRIPYVAFEADTPPTDEMLRYISLAMEAAEKKNIVLLIKTVGYFADSKRLCDFLDGFASDTLVALWDPEQTSKTGEAPATTVERLGAYIKHVHVRDTDENGNPAVIGEGTLPIDDVMRALSSVDYDGFCSLEWDPSWLSLSDFGVIFAHYVSFMSRYGQKIRARRLYVNHDGTGKYIWKKDELIDLTFSQVLDRLAEEFPDQYAVKYTTLDYTRTYEQFRNDVNDMARSLIALGVRRGTKVAIWATNVPEWFIAFWAVTKIGGVFVSVNTAYKIHEIEYLLRQSDTHTLFMISRTKDTNYADIIREICPELTDSVPGKPLHCKRLPFLRNIVTIGFKMEGCLTSEEALAKANEVPLSGMLRMASDVLPTDVCNMQYTSGTTGFPKGVMLTHYNVINNGKCIGDRMGLSTADRMMIQVPMFHCFGMVLSMTASMTHGTTICPLPYFSARASLDCINQEKITCFNGVPTMFIAMFNHPDYRKTDFSYMRTGIMAGAGCPPALMRRASQPDEMNMRGIVSVYGQTESSPGSTMSSWTDPLDIRCDTVGYAFPHICIKVINPDTGEEVKDFENGEFCSKGYNTMKGYYKMPGATAQTVDADGWLHSGDLAMRDDRGCYRITGRLKDMIIRGGENLYPKEIEEFIYTHPAVRDVQVVGVPDATYGEEAAACIILKNDQQVTAEDMRGFMLEHIARHKVPKYIVFVDKFPMNAAGKVLKYRIKEDLIKQFNIAVDTVENKI